MNHDRLDRYAPLTGIAAVVLTVAGVIAAGDSPGFLADGDEIARYLVDDNDAALAAGVLWMVAGVPLAWFVGALWSRLRATGDGASRLSTTALIGGTAGVTTWIGAGAAAGVAALRAGEDGAIEPGLAVAFTDLANIGWGAAAPIGFGILLLATGLAVVRSGAPLPRWLGWVSIVFAVWAFIPPISWAFAMVGWNLWLVVASAWLVWGDRSEAEPA
ncbi:MAG TPA: hypothetical protein PKA98_01260 [Acidimicrobiales bacterium]|nr:hypothetical protein [Acidimicrobiales bacterium]